MALVVLHSKQDKSVHSKQDTLWSWTMQEENGAFLLARLAGEDGVIAIGMKAADDARAGRPRNAQTLAGDGDAAVEIDAGGAALAPDVGPPRTRGSRP